MARRRVTRVVNRLAELPREIFAEVMRHVINIARLEEYGDVNNPSGYMYSSRYDTRTIRVFGRNWIFAPSPRFPPRREGSPRSEKVRQDSPNRSFHKILSVNLRYLRLMCVITLMNPKQEGNHH